MQYSIFDGPTYELAPKPARSLPTTPQLFANRPIRVETLKAMINRKRPHTLIFTHKQTRITISANTFRQFLATFAASATVTLTIDADQLRVTYASGWATMHDGAWLTPHGAKARAAKPDAFVVLELV